MANSRQTSVTRVRELEQELANRERNLNVIQETIENDPKSGLKLVEVRDLLVRRISYLRQQILNGPTRDQVELAA